MMKKSALIYMIYIYMLTVPLFTDSILFGRASDLTLIIIFLVYLLEVTICSEVRVRFINGIKNIYKDVLDILIIVLLIIMGFSVFYSADKSIAIMETFRFSTYAGLYFIIKYEVIDEKYKQNMLKIYIFTTVILSILGIIQYFTGIGLNKQFGFVYSMGTVNRITVTLSNPNNYGAYLILAIFPVLILAIKEKVLMKKVMYSAFFSMIFFNIIFTYSRNAWLGFAIGCLVLVLIYSWKLIAIFGGIGMLGIFIPRIFTRLIQIFDTSQNQSRINLWKLAVYMIKDHPIFGVGNGNYVSLYNHYALKYPKLRYENKTGFPCHNSYIKVQTELGILGIVSFLSIIVCAWLKVKNMIKECKIIFVNTFYIGFLASMLAFYFMNAFDNLFFVPKTTTYFWILLAISESFIYNRKKIT